MATDLWKGHINGILYGIQFEQVLDDSVVAWVARGVVEGRYPGDRTATLDALDRALRSEVPLNDEMGTRHGEESIRTFLQRLSTALQSRTSDPRPR
ncbi:hypothetical protein ACGFIW_08460 [Micromonospora sp. NPDC048935]|uniref:hypothetical protein n=1 Tax=Micromonospora sp. NPDC048935 TaxID=3364262 RepID=UPI00371514E0